MFDFLRGTTRPPHRRARGREHEAAGGNRRRAGCSIWTGQTSGEEATARGSGGRGVGDGGGGAQHKALQRRELRSSRAETGPDVRALRASTGDRRASTRSCIRAQLTAARALGAAVSGSYLEDGTVVVVVVFS